MNKRKIMLLAVSLCMVAILAVGSTLAYFTMEEEADNLFTMGYVDAEIEEDFDDGSELVPGSTIKKEVTVENTGTTGLYTRLHIAVRSDLDAGDPAKVPVRDFLTLNYAEENFGAGGWSFADTIDGAHQPTVPSDAWNWYDSVTDETGATEKMIIDGLEYSVYVVTYTSEIVPGASTPMCLESVMLNADVTATPVYEEIVNEAGETVRGELIKVVYDDSIVGNENFEIAAADFAAREDNMAEVHVKIWAEVVQADADGFTDAYVALNTAFGVPGTYNPWDE